jgi:hypothetical protein
MKTISYSDAVKRFNNSLILCNNITEVDPTIWEDTYFNPYDEDDNPVEVYQYFITDCTLQEVTTLYEWYGLKFAYSTALDCFILCVDHWGTSWNSVMIEDNSPKF